MPVVILYAEIGTKKFTSFHKVLSEKAEEGTLTYVLRHFVAVSNNVKLCLTDADNTVCFSTLNFKMLKLAILYVFIIVKTHKPTTNLSN